MTGLICLGDYSGVAKDEIIRAEANACLLFDWAIGNVQAIKNACPDMQIVGNQSSAFSLRWYQDRSLTILPTATVISVPLMAYRLLMLAWSLWLAVSLLNWLKWGWTCFSSNGLWNKKVAEKTVQ